MSQRAGETKSTYIHQTSVKQLLRCYGGPKSEQRGHSNHKARQRTTPSQHLEKRPRPRTCTACRVCINEGKKESLPSSAFMEFLPQKHLPLYAGDMGKHKQEAQKKPRPLKTSAGSRKMNSCHFRGDYREQDLRSSTFDCNRGTAAETREDRSFMFPVFPVKNLLDLCVLRLKPIDIYHSDVFSDEELRKWIIQFGGDEQAAFMARGIRRLQLAYEQGKAEMSQWTTKETSLPAAR